MTKAQLTRLPEPARPEEYEQASAEVLEHLSALPGAVAVYRTGGVGAPGISDLDLIVVVEGDQEIPAVWDRLSPRTRYLAMHSPFLVDPETFVRHRWFAHLEPLELVWGSALEAEQAPDVAIRARLIGVEGLLFSFLRAAKQGVTGHVKVRPTLCALHAVRFDLPMLELARERAPRAWRIVDQVAALREEWFSAGLDPRDRERRFRALAADSVPALEEALREVDPDASRVPRREVRLTGPWSNVLAEGPVDDDRMLRATRSVPLPLAGSSNRLAELSWRLSRYRLALPPGVWSMLHGSGDEEEAAFRDARQRIFRRYLGAGARPGYSVIGSPAGLLE